MRKTREVLRLYFDLNLGQRQVARSANISPQPWIPTRVLPLS
jgi:DNA-directed RNA polymerase specialized sigma subunit